MDADTSKVKKFLDSIISSELTENEKDILLFALLLKRGQQKSLVALLDNAADRRVCNDNINAALAMVNGPKWGMSQHGVIQRLETKYSDEEKAEIALVLRKMSDLLLDKLQLNSFVTSGTLLGLVREGRFLPHDFDFDMAYISNHTEQDAICAERRDVLRVIKESGIFTIKGTFTDKVQIHFNVGSQTGYMDLFVSFRSGIYFNEVPLKPDTLPIDEIVPLKTMPLYGHEVYVPKSPEKLLEINYGPSWRVPDPSFRFKFGEHAARYWFLHKAPINAE